MKSEGFVVSFVLCSAERELNVGWNGYILYIGIALILCPLRGNFSYSIPSYPICFVPKHVLQHVSQSFNAQSLVKPMITPIFALTAAARGSAPSPGAKINLEANRLKVSGKATMEGS